MDWVEGLLKDYLVQYPGLVITALLKFLGLCKDMGTKIPFSLQTDHFIFISMNHVTLPECTSHFIYQILRKLENMYIYFIFRVFLVNLELCLLIYYIIIT